MVLVFISTLLVKGVDEVEVGLLVSSSLGLIASIKGIFRVQYLSNLLLLLLSSSARLRFGGRLLPLLLAATRSPTGVLALSAKISWYQHVCCAMCLDGVFNFEFYITSSLPPNQIHPSSSSPPWPPSSELYSQPRGFATVSSASRNFLAPGVIDKEIFCVFWVFETCFIMRVSPTHSSQFLFHPFLKRISSNNSLHVTHQFFARNDMSKTNESFFSLFLPGSGQNKNNFRSPSSTSIFWPHTAEVRGSKAPEIHILQQFLKSKSTPSRLLWTWAAFWWEEICLSFIWNIFD